MNLGSGKFEIRKCMWSEQLQNSKAGLVSMFISAFFAVKL